MTPISTMFRCCQPELNMDKDYVVSIVAIGDGWGLQTAFGKHGTNLKPSPLPKVAVSYEEARKAYDKECLVRLRKGYVAEGAAGPAVAFAPKESSGIFAQLLNPIERGDAEAYLRDHAWVAQVKQDGERMMVIREAGEVRSANRKGQFIPGQEHVTAVIKARLPNCVLDGEYLPAMGARAGRYVVFDILSYEGKPLTGSTLEQRLRTLDTLPLGSSTDEAAVADAVVIAETARTEAQKRVMLAAAQADGSEGVVFKRASATILVGKNHTDQVKLKFWNSCSAVVTKQNAKSSIAVHLIGENGPVAVGNITISTGQAAPAAGSVVEVRYLYAYRNGSLFQPVYLGIRHDIDPSECLQSQLIYKGEPGAGLAAVGDTALDEEAPAASLRM